MLSIADAIPQVDDGLIQIMVVAQYAQGCCGQRQMAPVLGGHTNPADGEDAQDIAVREQEYVPRTRSNPADHAICAGAHRVHGLPTRAAVLEEAQAGRSARMSALRRPSYAP